MPLDDDDPQPAVDAMQKATMAKTENFKAGLARMQAIGAQRQQQYLQAQQQHLQAQQYLQAQQQQQNYSLNLASLAGVQGHGHWNANQALPGNTAYASGISNPRINPIYTNISAPCATEPEPEPIEDAGIRPGEVVGYRVWKITNYEAPRQWRHLQPHGFLTSTVMDQHIWVPGEPMTGTPCRNDSPGVHAWKSISQAMCMYPTPGYVFGSVELWGDIVEHERGYRAEFGQIKSLDGITDGDTELLARLRKRYGVGGRDDLSFDPPKRHSYGNMQAAGTPNTTPYGNVYQLVYDTAADDPPSEGRVSWPVVIIFVATFATIGGLIGLFFP